jgi:hypothetical protein
MYYTLSKKMSTWLMSHISKQAHLLPNRLKEDTLLERIGMKRLSHFLPFSTRSADEPKLGMASI